MKYKIIKKHIKDGRDFEVGYCHTKEQAVELVDYYNDNNEEQGVYYIKMAITNKSYKKRWK